MQTTIDESKTPSTPKILNLIFRTSISPTIYLDARSHIGRRMTSDLPHRLSVISTFHIVQQPFYQLFTGHTFVWQADNMKQVPIVQVVMSRWQKHEYSAFIQAIKEIQHRIPWVQPIIVDFEDTRWQASRVTIPEVDRKGCAFHLAQALFRKVQVHSNCWGISWHYVFCQSSTLSPSSEGCKLKQIVLHWYSLGNISTEYKAHAFRASGSQLHGAGSMYICELMCGAHVCVWCVVSQHYISLIINLFLNKFSSLVFTRFIFLLHVVYFLTGQMSAQRLLMVPEVTNLLDLLVIYSVYNNIGLQGLCHDGPICLFMSTCINATKFLHSWVNKVYFLSCVI